MGDNYIMNNKEYVKSFAELYDVAHDKLIKLSKKIDFINDSPFLTELGGNKKFFNVLLDDRAGLESAYNNLKYVDEKLEFTSFDHKYLKVFLLIVFQIHLQQENLFLLLQVLLLYFYLLLLVYY